MLPSFTLAGSSKILWFVSPDYYYEWTADIKWNTCFYGNVVSPLTQLHIWVTIRQSTAGSIRPWEHFRQTATTAAAAAVVAAPAATTITTITKLANKRLWYAMSSANTQIMCAHECGKVYIDSLSSSRKMLSGRSPNSKRTLKLTWCSDLKLRAFNKMGSS